MPVKLAHRNERAAAGVDAGLPLALTLALMLELTLWALAHASDASHPVSCEPRPD